MHSISEVGTNVPAFLAKLWKLVEDPTTNGLISWSANGSSFLIRNQAQFSRELLPLYYKHNNLASFIRQLNMYGFHKITSVESGGLKVDKDEMEFAHKYFLRGHPYLLENIKRKIPTAGVSSSSSSHTPTGSVKPEIVSRVLQDVRQMKGRQETLDSRFNAMKRENEALWRELALLRQKHMKQQQIVNKLIQFLVTLVQPNRGLGIKRTYPLMLNDTPNRNTHSNSRHSVSQPKVAKINVISDVMEHEELSPKGPVIHELDNNVEYIIPEDSYEDDLSGVEFVTGRDEEVTGAKLAAYAATNTSLSGLKSENGRLINNQGQPASPEAGAEASEIPVQLNKELDSVVPLVHSPYSSLGNLDSMPSSPVYPETDVTAVNLEEGAKAADMELQVNIPESCLLPSVEYPLSPEMLMGSIDPSVVSPAPNQVSKKKGQSFRNSKFDAKGKLNAREPGSKLARTPNNRKTKKTGIFSGRETEKETISQKFYPEIHLEEGSTSVNEEAAKLLDSVVGAEEFNVENAEAEIETARLNEDTENKDDSNMALACTLGTSGEKENSSQKNIREELDMHLDTMQSDLDMLKDMLMKGSVAPVTGVSSSEGDILSGVGGLEGYCLDASALLGVCPASLGHLLDPAVSEGGGHILSKLFGSDDPIPFGVSSDDNAGNLKANPDLSVTGNELATYNPTLLDLVEDDDNSQLLDWCDAASSGSKDDLCNDSYLGTPAPELKRKDQNEIKQECFAGKGSEKNSSTSILVQKNSSQVRRKSK